MTTSKMFLKNSIFLLMILLACSSTGSSDDSNDGSIDGITKQKDYLGQGGVTVYSIPVGDCPNTKSTPLVVNNQLLIGMGEKGRGDDDGCVTSGDYGRSLLVFDIPSKTFIDSLEVGRFAGTMHYQESIDTLFWTVLGNAEFGLIDASTLEIENSHNLLSAGSDSSGVYLDGKFYFGTINTPEAACNSENSPNADCGNIASASMDGDLDTLDGDDGFRAWVTGSPVTDGQYLFAGTGADCYGSACHSDDSDYEYRYGCSIVKFDKNLNILASYDPGDEGCLEGASTESDAVAGEVVLGADDDVWVQMTGPSDSSEKSEVFLFDKNLDVQCVAEFDGSTVIHSADFYQAPSVDKDGNAYVALTLPSGDSSLKAVLARIAPCRSGCGPTTSCTVTTLAEITDREFSSTPVLVDDQYVLVSSNDKLFIYSLAGELQVQYTLGSTDDVLASPVVHEGTVYILSGDGILTVIENSGLNNYGSAIWPRYRKDNHASAQ